MKEQMKTIIFIRDAITWRIRMVSKSHEEMYGDTYGLQEKIKIIVKSLANITETRELVTAFSSYNHGVHLLSKVFPISENPEPFHSFHGIVNLLDKPVQVLGWKEYSAEIEQGVQSGLSYDYIIAGFHHAAAERGIDLEWHFHSVPFNTPDAPQEP